MEAVLAQIATGDEAKIGEALKSFNDTNVANYKLGETTGVRKKFCGVLLSNFSSLHWSPEVTFQALNALRIFTREQEGASDLISPMGLTPLIHIAGLDKGYQEIKEFFESEDAADNVIAVMIEAVKCLCNLVLNNHPVADMVSDLGCLSSLQAWLAFFTTHHFPFDMMFFDLRLMFLITACGPDQRRRFREEFRGPYVMVKLLDSILFGLAPESEASLLTLLPQKVSTVEKPSSKATTPPSPAHTKVHTPSSPTNTRTDSEPSKVTNKDKTSVAEPSEDEDTVPENEVVKSKRKVGSVEPVRNNCFVLKSEMSEKTCMLINEALKIIFSQTVHWNDQEKLEQEEEDLFTRLAHLLRIMICSIPLYHSKTTTQTLNHCCEVMMNMPRHCHHLFLLPPDVTITPALKTLYPSLFVDPQTEEDSAHSLYCIDLDKLIDDYNMGMAVCLLNYLNFKLVNPAEIDRHGMSIVLGALTLLSKGNRSIRRYFKSEILPPLQEVKERPESTNSLKGRLVRLMTAGAHDCMDMVAEFLFVLCKESASRLVKHTGYGNAAGLLMSRGLLGGGRSEGQDEYSDDSGCSETEEYQTSRGTIDPVTGGPSLQKDSPLDHMTPEEIELEAEKLGSLFNQLQDTGMFKLIGKDNKPVHFPKSDKSGYDEEDDGGPHCSGN